MKKLTSILLLFCLIFGSVQSAAAHGVEFQFGYFGTVSESTYLKADGEANDDMWIDVSVGGSGRIDFYSYGTLISSMTAPVTAAAAPSNANSLKLVSLDGSEIYMIEAHSTNPLAEHVIFDGAKTNDEGQVVDPDYTDLYNVMADVNQSVSSNGITLKEILNTIGTSNDLLGSVLNELQTNISVNYPSSPQSPALEDNRPTQPDVPYEDNTTYFTDNGEAATPPALPIAPEPEAWSKEDGTDYVPEETLVKEETKVKDGVPVRDGVPAADTVPVKDSVPIKDSTKTQDPTPIKDGVPTKDTIPTKGSVPVKDLTPSHDLVPTKDPTKTRTPPPQQSPVDNTLPDWTSP
jgi:hypothetical protein